MIRQENCKACHGSRILVQFYKHLGMTLCKLLYHYCAFLYDEEEQLFYHSDIKGLIINSLILWCLYANTGCHLTNKCSGVAKGVQGAIALSNELSGGGQQADPDNSGQNCENLDKYK